jgi:hypothetical protein
MDSSRAARGAWNSRVRAAFDEYGIYVIVPVYFTTLVLVLLALLVELGAVDERSSLASALGPHKRQLWVVVLGQTAGGVCIFAVLYTSYRATVPLRYNWKALYAFAICLLGFALAVGHRATASQDSFTASSQLAQAIVWWSIRAACTLLADRFQAFGDAKCRLRLIVTFHAITVATVLLVIQEIAFLDLQGGESDHRNLEYAAMAVGFKAGTFFCETFVHKALRPEERLFWSTPDAVPDAPERTGQRSTVAVADDRDTAEHSVPMLSGTGYRAIEED